MPTNLITVNRNIHMQLRDNSDMLHEIVQAYREGASTNYVLNLVAQAVQEYEENIDNSTFANHNGEFADND